MPLENSVKQAEKKNQETKANSHANEQEMREAGLTEEQPQLLRPVLGSSAQEQASHLNDPRFMAAQRQGMAGQIGRLAGNNQLQRLVDLGRKASSKREIHPASSRLVQRGIWDSIREWWRGLWSTDPEDVVRNLDSGLGHASTVLDVATSGTVDPQARGQLERLTEQVQGLQEETSGIIRILDTVDKIEKVQEFIEALNDIPDDIASNPEEAADAFGRLFAAAGELGQMLPEGPWTGYFEFLAGARNFFTDMLHILNPDYRPSTLRLEQQVEAEGPYTTHRGVD